MMDKPVLASDVTAFVDELAPPGYAMPNDVIGLQVGRLDKAVKRVLLALDAYPQVIHEAVTEGADLLLTHHAMLFRAPQRIDTATARGSAIAEALCHDLTVYNAHTNLDIAEGGVNDVLAELLDLSEVEILDRMQSERLRKLVVFVPETHHEAVLQALCQAGAGHIGQYSHCTFNTHGTGTFLPGDTTHPFIGEPGKLARAREVRLETIVPERLLEPVVRAMLAVHPYEEAAYDVYPLELMGKAIGIGRVGNLQQPMKVADFAALARDVLGLRHIRYGGDGQKLVQRVAVLGGSGGRWATKARALGAEVLLTADCDHHAVAEAWQDGLSIVDATHAALERPVLEQLKKQLQARFGDRFDVMVAQTQEDPFTWI